MTDLLLILLLLAKAALCGLLFAWAWREGGTHRAGRGSYTWRLAGVPLPLGARMFRVVPPAVGLALAIAPAWDWRAGASLAASLVLGLAAVAQGHASHQDAGAVRVGDAWAPADGETTEAGTRWLDRLFGPETATTPRRVRAWRDGIGMASIGLNRHAAWALPWVWTLDARLGLFAAAGALHFMPYLWARDRWPADPVAPAERGAGYIIGLGLYALAIL